MALKMSVTIRADKAEYFINMLNFLLEAENISEEAEDKIAKLLYTCFGLGKPNKQMIPVDSILQRLAELRKTENPIERMIDELTLIK